MLRLDDRTGNVLTTIGLFALVAGVAFAARATLAVFLLALLLAYLLEPVVGKVQSWLPRGPRSRVISIATVYLVAIALLIGVGWAAAPAFLRQVQRLKDGAPAMGARLAESQFLAQYRGVIAGAAERAAGAVAAGAEEAGWLLLVPIIAVFFLNNREELIDGSVDLLARRRDRASVRHTIMQIDAMLAQYTRAQLATAGFSAFFYSGAMAMLHFPYPLVLGVLGGALEFLPMVGWILAATAILTTGWLAQANWIWMAGVIVLWRVIQNVFISPRILGNSMQMDPIVVFLALMVGGQLAGLPGVILAVPAVAILRIVWLERSSQQSAAA